MRIGILENDFITAKSLFESVLKTNNGSRVAILNGGDIDCNNFDLFVMQRSSVGNNLLGLHNIGGYVGISFAKLDLDSAALDCAFVATNNFALAQFNIPKEYVTKKDESDETSYVDKFIENLYTNLLIKRKLVGADYLRDALKMTFRNPAEIHKNLTKLLYPAIANKHNSTGARVERAIRTVIRDCYVNGKLAYLNNLLGCPIIRTNYIPTNGELISAIAERINYELRTGCASIVNIK